LTAGTGSGSSANPFQVLAGGVKIIDVNSTGSLSIGSAGTDISVGRSILASSNVGAGNAFWFYNSNLLMQKNTAIGDSGNAYQFADNFGVTNRQIQASSLWIGATINGTRVGGFDPSGSGTVAGLQTATAEKTANYTASSDDLSVLCDATAGAVTITLPAAPKTGEWKGLKKVDSSANACTYSGNGKNIEGAPTLVYSTQYQHAMAQYDGTQWWLY
jgi:hypothetical protein